ncbi:hypothetical protein [uncultured Clostridium sp.]|uniref:hypothetical protein n=1 Tax=uncultured Clostridium sp. TaxID=59620 RepID=UPI0026266AA4|nr:hypothetical protein [uncultured Clostridium sp.]
MSARWSEENKIYLEKSWGNISTKRLADRFGVSEQAVKTMAYRMGLGSMLNSKDFLIAKELEEILGSSRKTIKKHITERGLKAREVKLSSGNRKYVAIQYKDFIEWLENNLQFWDGSKVDILSLKAMGVNENLLNKKFKEDTDRYNKNKINKLELEKIKNLYLKGYTYEDIAKIVNKNKGAIHYKLSYLAEKGEFELNRNNSDHIIRRTKRECYGWSKTQDEILTNLFMQGVSLKEISQKVGKSLSATKSRNQVLTKRRIKGLSI